jgi:anti-sigma factor RsiW
MHLTDEQLNEYLDGETNERAQIELHLSTCEECSARLAALRDLFSEIESLPELDLSPEFITRSSVASSQTTGMPRALQWTLALQTALVVVTIVVAAPFVMQFVSLDITSLSVPTPLDVFTQLRNQWAVWLETFSTLPVPTLPRLPLVDISSLFVMSTIAGVSLLWLIGNGLLLRNQMK